MWGRTRQLPPCGQAGGPSPRDTGLVGPHIFSLPPSREISSLAGPVRRGGCMVPSAVTHRELIESRKQAEERQPLRPGRPASLGAKHAYCSCAQTAQRRCAARTERTAKPRTATRISDGNEGEDAGTASWTATGRMAPCGTTAGFDTETGPEISRGSPLGAATESVSPSVSQ